jgi:hypothetical protein
LGERITRTLGCHAVTPAPAQPWCPALPAAGQWALAHAVVQGATEPPDSDTQGWPCCKRPALCAPSGVISAPRPAPPSAPALVCQVTTPGSPLGRSLRNGCRTAAWPARLGSSVATEQTALITPGAGRSAAGKNCYCSHAAADVRAATAGPRPSSVTTALAASSAEEP